MDSDASLRSAGQNRGYLTIGFEVSQRVTREQPDDEDNSAPFAFRAVEDVLVVRHPVSKVPESGQCVIEPISVGTCRECFVKVGNPDGFLVSIREKVGPEAEHELSHDLAGYWLRLGCRGCVEPRPPGVAPWNLVHVARTTGSPVPSHHNRKQRQQCRRICPVGIAGERGRCKLAIARISQTNFQVAEIMQESRAQRCVPLVELKRS